MTISYNWLCEYLPFEIDPGKLGKILTSVGLEVESMEVFESIKGGLKDLVVGEILECKPHPNADKLKVTIVDVGSEVSLQIICGANNVAAGQKVIIAKPGVTIHPSKGEPVTLQVATIRGMQSFGMICAEDEIGLGENHAGIIVLPEKSQTGLLVSELYEIQQDYTYEIGLTPNRMDAMSHLGVAKDVCAFFSHHENKPYHPVTPFSDIFESDSNKEKFSIQIDNRKACRRYSGISLSGVKVCSSPLWLQERLRSIGVRPINNIVDITNFILHETGQPLHAFNADIIKNKKIIVKNCKEGTSFVTLDEKMRKLDADDLMICNGDSEPMCIAGVFGGFQSGVNEMTKDIFLESAWFNPVDIRKTSFRHGLRTDAAMRFEKNVDISNTVEVLKRAALLIREIAGGTISSEVFDEYPEPVKRSEVILEYKFLQKLSGKMYSSQIVKKILQALGFEIVNETTGNICISVPFNKPDIMLPADIVEEVMRIDGYDNIEIPASITITPAGGSAITCNDYREKFANYLAGVGFNEIFTNSITNAAYFEPGELKNGVKLLNNLSAVHNLMRPSMLETGLEAVSYNLNRKATQLQFFEYGKTYKTTGIGEYAENEHLCMYLSGNRRNGSWKEKQAPFDFFYLKGLVMRLLETAGIEKVQLITATHPKLSQAFSINAGNETIGLLGIVEKAMLARFDIKQLVLFADLHWQMVIEVAGRTQITFRELPKQLPVNRDLAMVVPRSLPYSKVEESIRNIQLEKLQDIALFDVFESDKLGVDKKSFAVSFSFLDEIKTLTDKEIDLMMQTIMQRLEQDVAAEIRKQ